MMNLMLSSMIILPICILTILQSKKKKKKKQQQPRETKTNSMTNLPEDILINKETKPSMIINLPDVLINKILVKLGMKSLGKLSCVSKYLQSFITSPAFLNIYCHYQTNNDPSVLLVSGNKTLIYSINLKGTHLKPYCPKKIKITSFPSFSCSLFFGSFNGLLCFVERKNSPPSLWNPFTKEYKKLPPPFPPKTPFSSNPDIIFGYIHVLAYGFGYDSIINDYKVIQCENTIYRQYIPPSGSGDITEYTMTNFQVYTLGTDTWTRINDNPYELHYTTPYHYKTPGMFVNGALHWILRETKSFGSKKIIAIDIHKEMFRAEVPKPHSNLSDYWSLHVLKGCLCIYERLEHEISHCIDVWMMKDYGVRESWTKLFTIHDCHAFASSVLDFKVLKICKNGKVIVARDYTSLHGLIVYDPTNRGSRPINIGKIIPGDIFYKEIYIESLVSLNTGIYRDVMVRKMI